MIWRRLFHAAAEVSQAGERCLQVAVIGAPNTGKSLLTNQLVRAQVSSVSSKMDTTTANVTAAITEHGRQLVFVDSPGTIGIQHARDIVKQTSMRILTDPDRAMEHADYVLVVHDPMLTGDYIQHRVLHLLHRYSHLSSSLVINKIDLVERRSDLLELVRILCNGQVGGEAIRTVKTTVGRLGRLNERQRQDTPMKVHTLNEKLKDEKWQERYRKLMTEPTHKCPWGETKYFFSDIRGWPNFEAVFFVSALNGEGIDTLREHLLNRAETKPYMLSKSALTTKKPQEICRDAIRAQLLDNVPSYIAYELKVNVTEWQMDGEVLQIVADIICEKEKWAHAVLGKEGRGRIVRIGQAVNELLQNLFGQQLFVRLLVKHKGRVVTPLYKKP